MQRIWDWRSKHDRLPLYGHVPSSHPTPLLDGLQDDELDRLNRLLPWQAYITDRRGRRFGNNAWKGKRDTAQEIPDRRIVLMNERFDLSTKTVLEIGCFEGIHTAGLLQYAAKVKAVDSRVENVVKTIVRCAMLGGHPQIFACDVESVPADAELLAADYAHHVGVLYHLHDPVSHLLDLGRYVRHGIMLDTHYADIGEATGSYAVNGIDYPYKEYREFGRNDVFSGMSGWSKWLLLDDLRGALQRAGFLHVDIVETRHERNGPRVLLFASR
jgi:SAM-dependent methyltransferase